MLHKLFIHFSLVVLFAFAQMGVATHEISHFSDLAPHKNQQQPDKSTAHHQCEQCISHAGVADGMATAFHIFAFNQSQSQAAIGVSTHFFSVHSAFYSARAPPQVA